MAPKAKAAPKKRGKGKMKGDVATMPKKNARAKIGGNSGLKGLSDDEKKATINKLNRLLSNYEEAHKEAKSLKSEYTTARKAAKKIGFNLSGYDIMRAADGMDHGVAIKDYADAGDYLRVMKSPLATQYDLFGNLEPQVAQEDAAVLGARAGKAGQDRAGSNPFTPGSDDFVRFDEAWTASQVKIAEEMRPN